MQQAPFENNERPVEARDAVWTTRDVPIISCDTDKYGDNWSPYEENKIYELKFTPSFALNREPGWVLASDGPALTRRDETLHYPHQWESCQDEHCKCYWLNGDSLYSYNAHRIATHGGGAHCYVVGCHQTFADPGQVDEHVKDSHGWLIRSEKEGVYIAGGTDRYFGFLQPRRGVHYLNGRDAFTSAFHKMAELHTQGSLRKLRARCCVTKRGGRSRMPAEKSRTGEEMTFYQGYAFCWIEVVPDESTMS